MSTQGLRQCLGRDVRDHQRRTLPELDLNYPPPDGNIAANSQELSAEVQRDSEQIEDCVEVIDDDLAIINQRIFSEAQNNSQRKYSQLVYKLRNMLIEAGGLINRLSELEIWYIRQRGNISDAAITDGDLCINEEASHSNELKNFAAPLQLLQNPAPEAPTFSCPICMGPLNQAATTKCGHIFCMDCIKAAVAAQGRCPICRQKLGKRGIIKVYLPTIG